MSEPVARMIQEQTAEMWTHVHTPDPDNIEAAAAAVRTAALADAVIGMGVEYTVLEKKLAEIASLSAGKIYDLVCERERLKVENDDMRYRLEGLEW